MNPPNSMSSAERRDSKQRRQTTNAQDEWKVEQHGNRAYTQVIEVEKDQLSRLSYLQVATLHPKGGAIVPPHR